MPINNGQVFCINHPDTILVRNPGFNAVTKVDTTGISLTFNPTTGVPLVVYYCETCGYVELYAAQKTSYWNEEKFGGTPSERAERFEELVAEALRSQLSPFGTGVVLKNEQLEYGGRTYESDIIVKTNNGIFIIEIKSSASRNALMSAVHQVQQVANVYYLIKGEDVPLFPIVVIPAEVNTPDEVSGIPVLKFDPERRIFTNGERVLNILRNKNGLRTL